MLEASNQSNRVERGADFYRCSSVSIRVPLLCAFFASLAKPIDCAQGEQAVNTSSFVYARPGGSVVN